MDQDWKDTNPKDSIAGNKVPLDLVPSTLSVAAALAFLEGAHKYGAFNWRATGVRASVYLAALQRHMIAWTNGEEMDPDSGLPHLFKAAACIAILIDARECGVLADDRPTHAPCAAMMKTAERDVRRINAKYKADPVVEEWTPETCVGLPPPLPPLPPRKLGSGFDDRDRSVCGCDSSRRTQSTIPGRMCIFCGGVIL